MGRWIFALLFTGCLVTKKIDFEEEVNVPPSITSARGAASLGTALGQVVRINFGLNGADPLGSTDFPVIVRDPNVKQTLQWQVFLNFSLAALTPNDPGSFEGSLIDNNVLPPSNDNAIDRELTFRVPHTRFRETGACYKVELLVSSDFKDVFPNREPVQDGDLASAVWWVGVTDDNAQVVDLSRCP